MAKDRHAWLLLGYDHTDGNDKWKYQGRFVSLSASGSRWPRAPVLGLGVALLPFAMLLTEGIEAYAMFHYIERHIDPERRRRIRCASLEDQITREL